MSDVRLLREAVAEVVGRRVASSISGLSGDLQQSLAIAIERQPDIVLLDAAFPDGTDAVGRIRHVAPRVRVVVFGVVETEEDIVIWAEAGVAGYIPRTASLTDLVPRLADIMRGEQTCSGRVGAGLMRRIACVAHSTTSRGEAQFGPTLTAREQEIVQLIAAGLSNKDIARRLKIGVATTKSHVHNLLGKLDLQRRGQVAFWMHDHEAHLTRPSPFIPPDPTRQSYSTGALA